MAAWPISHRNPIIVQKAFANIRIIPIIMMAMLMRLLAISSFHINQVGLKHILALSEMSILETERKINLAFRNTLFFSASSPG